MNSRDVNFRVIKARVKDLVDGTPCQTAKRPEKPVVFPKPNRPSNGYFGWSFLCIEEVIDDALDTG